MTDADLTGLGIEIGFDHAAVFDAGSLVFRPEVKEMCAADRCGSFGRSWSCPPAAGNLELIRKRSERFSRGLLVQTEGKVAGSFDLTAIHDIMTAHNRYFDTLVRQLRFYYPGCMPMGTGACTRCRKCTYPNRPCRHPDRMYPSMEACGLLVSEVCSEAGLRYNYGEDAMTFTACVLVD